MLGAVEAEYGEFFVQEFPGLGSLDSGVRATLCLCGKRGGQKLTIEVVAEVEVPDLSLKLTLLRTHDMRMQNSCWTMMFL